jgi:hypothetical protein
LTDARDRIAVRIEETRALLPLVGSIAALPLTARITAYETALADIDAWMAEGEEQQEEAAPEREAEQPATGPEIATDAIAGTPAHSLPMHVGFDAQLQAPEQHADDAPAEPRAPLGPIGGAGATVWTAERDELVIRDYGRLGGLAMLPALNALPGEPVQSAQAVKNRAGVLRARGVPVPPRPTGRPSSAAPAAPREPTPPTTIPDDEIAEARDMMRASDKCGARELHDYFGWPLPQAQQVAETIREELKAAA